MQITRDKRGQPMIEWQMAPGDGRVHGFKTGPATPKRIGRIRVDI